MDNQDRINNLALKIERLQSKNNLLNEELILLKNELKALRNQDFIEEKPEIKNTVVQSSIIREEIIVPKNISIAEQKQIPKIPPVQKESSFNLEKLIGENIINKIGILITIIGVIIGVRYSIEHNLINPLTRIILGYIFGISLLIVGFKLKEKYINYSAVLVSGSITILYFITFVAYSFYGIFPQTLTFFLMLIFTVFAVIAALNYNQQVIALIGLVGAYAIPFLLSDGSGRVLILFSYMSIINIGILVVSFKKDWKLLYYSSFGFSWLIFGSWIIFNYQYDKHFSIALIFSILFFLIFYAVFLVFKLKNNKPLEISNFVMLLINSFLFYSILYFLFNSEKHLQDYLGLITVLNGVIHFGVSIYVKKQDNQSYQLFHLIMGLALVFITLAIPVQLDGSYVTLAWVFEAAVLFWLGRIKQLKIYEIISYFVIIIAFISLMHDWTSGYVAYSEQFKSLRIQPFFNGYLLSSLLFVAAMFFINFVNQKSIKASDFKHTDISNIYNFIIPAILLTITYFAFFLEIQNYFTQLYVNSEIIIEPSDNKHFNVKYLYFKIVFLLMYSLVYVAILLNLNVFKIKSEQLSKLNLILVVLVLLSFVFSGFYALKMLKDLEFNKSLTAIYGAPKYNILIRYLLYVLLAVLLFSTRKQLQNMILKDIQKLSFITFEIVCYSFVILILSSELITIFSFTNSNNFDRLGLSIFWGIFALVLIVLGIYQSKQHLRIFAIVIFSITLLKLFFYDISHLSTISKTIVFVSLGVLLLIISFLYNKYKNKIEENETNL